ncbi:MAG TPA: polyribonucleotide nucleotidyltransferase [Clostridia bacterium]|nr:polyribonucleotide nucleotidyltransferase [Clostridia bacterium]
MATDNALVLEMDLGGRTLSLETGRIAKQANGAVFVRYGETVVLVTATCSKEPREGIDFFPLTVDYEEKLYAAGKIPGGFIKREGRPSEKAILSARLLDRPIRPLFPNQMRNDVQIVATVMSVDQDNVPEIVAMIGASAALTISDIPFEGPIGGVAVGRTDGEFIINPTVEDSENSDLRLVVAGTGDAVMMVEANASEITEGDVIEAIDFGHEAVCEIVSFIKHFREEAEKLGLAKPKIHFQEDDVQGLIGEIKDKGLESIREAMHHCAKNSLNKKDREEYLGEIERELTEEFLEVYPDQGRIIAKAIDNIEKEILRKMVVEESLRIDGRAPDEVRQIGVDVGVLPRSHGSGLFTRGQTQVLSVVTLGAVSDEQILDGLGVEDSKRFMHHYNFPPFSVGETRPMRGPGRREIGHGALAERALETVLPGEADFPYTIRIVSEVLESNGSSSMASVCGSTLALMDAGVPISKPIAGVAMGLIKEDNNLAILTDIQGIEDFNGDMDFKVAGTKDGITSLQMDIKIKGVTQEILNEALSKAYTGRMFILGEMLNVISEPREDLSKYAPRIIHTVIDPDKIRDVIGPGGKVIRKIIEETGAEIDIEDDGRVFIAAVDQDAGKKAFSFIESLTKDVEVGRIYTGRVTKVMDFGAFVEVIPGVLGLPGKEGLVHISQLAHYRVNKVEDVVKDGEQIMVKAIGYDSQGRLKLSKKEAMPRDKKPKEDGDRGKKNFKPRYKKK